MLRHSLSIVDRIARVLDHPVHLSSKPGGGTSFRVEIPVEAHITPIAASKPRPASRQAVSDLDGLTVLCVDNEPHILDGLALLMRGWNCRVETCASVADLSERLKRQSVPPDAIVADYHLGDGDGIAAVGLVRQRWGSDIPAVLATADRTHDVRNRAEAQSISIFNKPLKPAALRAYLNQIAAARKSAAE